MGTTRSIAGIHKPDATTTSWITPRFILDALGAPAAFDLDPCACDPQPWPTAREMWTHNGLMRPWHGRVWLNPPYGQETREWIANLAGHGDGIALIFARTETRIFFPHVWKHATGIFFLKGRVTFCTPEGTPAKEGHNSGGPSCLIAYGRGCADILRRCVIPGHYIHLTPP